MCRFNQTQQALEAEWMAIKRVKDGRRRATLKTDFLIRLIDILEYHGKILSEVRRQRRGRDAA